MGNAGLSLITSKVHGHSPATLIWLGLVGSFPSWLEPTFVEFPGKGGRLEVIDPAGASHIRPRRLPSGSMRGVDLVDSPIVPLANSRVPKSKLVLSWVVGAS